MSENTTMLRRFAGVAAIAALAMPATALANGSATGHENGKGHDKDKGSSSSHVKPAGHTKDADWCAKGDKADHWKCTPEDDKPGNGPKPDKPGKPDNPGNNGNNGNQGNNGNHGNDGKPSITIINNVPAPAPAAGVQQSAASKAALPCTSRRRFRLHLGVIRRGNVTLNGRSVRVVRNRTTSSFATIDLRKRAKGTYTVRTRVVTRGGKRKTGTRRYRTCA